MDLLLTVSSDELCGRGLDEKVVLQTAAISLTSVERSVRCAKTPITWSSTKME